jgi:NAD(P)-dependent dehydrogenase (short-subunit alcohol dehydrogenase family)
MPGLPAPESHLGIAAACSHAVEQVCRQLGRIDGLINTVGTFAMAGIEDADAA